MYHSCLSALQVFVPQITEVRGEKPRLLHTASPITLPKPGREGGRPIVMRKNPRDIWEHRTNS